MHITNKQRVNSIASPFKCPKSFSRIECAQYLLCALFFFITVFYLLMISWRAWGSPTVDFAEELYIPWQLSQGKILYHQVSHFYGPLSQYWHAFLFKLFGISFSTLIASNLLVCTGMVVAINAIFSNFIRQPLAFILTTLFIPIFILGHHSPVGGFNYMAPYAHETSHGTLLLLVQLWLLFKLLKNFSNRLSYLFYFLFGMVFLTKPELTLAGATLVAAHVYLFRPNLQILAKSLLSFTLPLLPFIIYFSSHVGLLKGLWYTAGAYTPLLETSHASHLLFKDLFGIGNLSLSTFILPRVIGFYSLFLLSAHLISRFWKSNWASWLFTFVWAIILATSPAIVAGALLTLSMISILIISTFCPGLYNQQQDRIKVIIMGLMSLTLLFKMAFLPRLGWYGFSLALPAFILFIVFNYQYLAKFIRADPRILRFGMIAATLIISWQFTGISIRNYKAKTFALGTNGDLMYLREYPHGTAPAAIFDALYKFLSRKTTAKTTLWVLPDFSILNYLARRENSTPYYAALSAKSLFEHAGGVKTIIEQLEKAPPDLIIYLRKDPKALKSEPRIRGSKGYAEPIFQWIETHYKIADQLGTETKDFSKLRFVILKKSN